MKSLSRFLLLSLILVAFVLGSGLAAPAGAEKNVLRFGCGLDPGTLDPHNYKATTDLLVDNLIFENLVTFDLNMKVIPALATSYENVDDTTWRFKLRRGVKFHDGTPFNAEVAKFNLLRMKDAPRGKPYFGMITEVVVEHEYTIVVKTAKPFAPFIKNMCIPVGGMMSPQSIKKYGKDVTAHPVGTGQYKLKSWRPKEKLVLERNEEYWGQKAKLKEFVMLPIPEEGARNMAFEADQIDVISDFLPHRIERYKKDKNIQVITGPATRLVWLGINDSDPVLKNVKLREAIAYAVDRDTLVEHVVEGLAINAQTVIPEIIMKSKKKYKFDYDPQKAKKLLAEAGYPDGLTLNLWTPEGRYLKDRQIAEAIQGQLAKVGIKTNLRVMEWGAYLDSLFRHEQQLWIIGWGFSTGDPDAALRGVFYSTSKFNFTAVKNPKIDKLLDTAVATLDAAKRDKMYEQLQQMIIDEVYMIPIYHKMNIYAVRHNVHDFFPTPLELIDISKTTVD